MAHIYSPHDISLEPSQNFSFLIYYVPVIYRHMRRQYLHLSVSYRQYCLLQAIYLLAMSWQVYKMEQLCRNSEWLCKCPRRHVQEASEAASVD